MTPREDAAEARRLAEVRAARLHAEVDARPPGPADQLVEVLAATVADALADGDLAGRLRAAGWALAHIGDGSSCPDAPSEWVEEALNLTDPGWIDPFDLIERLWRDAWTAGQRAGAAPPGRRRRATQRGGS